MVTNDIFCCCSALRHININVIFMPNILNASDTGAKIFAITPLSVNHFTVGVLAFPLRQLAYCERDHLM